jgi:DNA-binding transcriptional MerR regulator
MSEHKTFTLDEIEQQTGFDKRTIAYYVQQGLLPKVGRRGPKTRYPQLFLDRLQFVNMIRKKQDLGEIGSLTLSEIGDILNRVSAETIAGVVAGEEPLRVVDHHGDLQPLTSTAPSTEPLPLAVQKNGSAAAIAAEAAEISESLMGAPQAPDRNRPVRLGLMDANTTAARAVNGGAAPADAPQPETDGRVDDLAAGGGFIQPARRYEDEIKKRDEAQPTDAPGDDTEPDAADAEAAPPSIEIERLGWFLARLQRAMTGDRRRRTGTTESWQRALVTPELTISARNLKDADAYMLDAVARILKKLLWEAWEE